MTENEIVSKFSEYGYFVTKLGNGGYYSVFDRRTARRIRDNDTLDSLVHLADDIFNFDFMARIMDDYIQEMKRIYAEKANRQDPEQVEASPPADPEQGETSDPEMDQEQPPEADKDTPVFDLVCKGCGKHFQSTRKKSYCSEACYPSNQRQG